MKPSRIGFVIILASALALAIAVNAPAGAAGSGTSASASKPRSKFPPVTTQQVQSTRQEAMDLFERTRKDIAPEMHSFETEHFLIFSAWPKSNDKPLGDTCEQLYQVLCRQFDVQPKEDVWIGKLAMFVFEPAEFAKFAEWQKVDPKAAGYFKVRGDFVYVAVQTPPQKEFFFELLAHETTHVFNSRYEGPRHLPQWLDEGIAEMITSTLLPKSGTARRAALAMKQTIRDNRNIIGVFESVDLAEYDYGIVRSVVDYLVARDRKAFLKMVSLLKGGTSEADALKECYGLTRQELVDAWKQAVARTVR